MNVLALNPPFHTGFSRSQRSPAVIKSGVMYYPIWLAYAAGVLEKDGFTVKLLDAPADRLDLEAVLQAAEAFAPRLLVMDCSTPSIYNDIAVAEALQERIPGLFVLIVGPHVSALPEESLRISPVINAVARGEYDYTVRDVARWLEGGGAIEAIQGVSYLDDGGQVVHNPNRPFIRDLDELPFVSEVYKRHLTVENYFYSITQFPEVAIITGRGCPYQCTYCVWPQTLNGHGYRKRSVQNVADEFAFIARELPQVKEVFIEDDTLTVDQRRSIALSEELIRRENRLPFTANSRADVSFETLDWLHRAGLRLVCVGFESGDQEVLDRIKKKVRVEQFYAFRQAARQANVMIHGCFMAGNPGETRASLQKTLSLAKALDPDTAQFFPIMVYPGTEAYQWAVDNNRLSTTDFREWLTPDGLHRSLVNHDDLTAEDLVRWCDRARLSFYLRPGFLAKKSWQVFTHPGEATRIVKAARTFVRYLFRPSLKEDPSSKDSFVPLK